MKNQHISPLIKAGFVITTVLALWMGIQEYSEVKAVSNDCILAVLNMLFVLTVVYGSSYILYLLGGFVIPAMMRKRPDESSPETTPFTKGRFDKLLEEKTKRSRESTTQLLGAIKTYSSLTFCKKLCPEQLGILHTNIELLSQGKDSSAGIDVKLPGITSNDLYHFGWNVGKRLKCSNIQIAWFLKDTFKAMLSDVSIDTIQTKLAIKEGNFSLKLIPLDQELVPHIFPDTLAVESCLEVS